MKKKRSYTSHDLQNEMLQLCANQVLRSIGAEAKESGPLGIIIDGCQDGDSEQISLCIRYCMADLTIHEEVVGFYATSKGDAASVSNIILDVLLRLGLEVTNLVGQAYDGASVMSGHISGVQERIREKAPMANYVHCNAHCLDLVLQEAGKSVPFVRDAISVVHDIGTFLNASALRRARFVNVQRKMIEDKRLSEEESIDSEVFEEHENTEYDVHDVNKPTGVRKLCLTRWLARTPALQDVLRAYDALQVSFAEFADTKNSNSAKANGIAVMLDKSLTYMGIYVSLLVFRRAEQASRRLQQRGIMLRDAMDTVRELRQYYVDHLRTDEKWEEIWQHVISRSTELDLEMPQLPRIRRPPKKLEQSTTATGPHQFHDVKTKCKVSYFELVDLLVAELDRRFNQPGMNKQLVIERVLTGTVEPNDIDVIMNSYSVFIPSRSSLIRQLESLKDLCDGDQSNLSDVLSKLRDVHQKKLDVLFKDVLILARIYLACPVTSVECERSFSVMRRLKTWLRRTTGQSRLNHELILVVHSARPVDLDGVIGDFVRLNDQRKDDFGLNMK